MIVLGLGYGDEGKGLTTSFLCSLNQKRNPIVVRFNGGHQAGHTVVYNNKRHIFSSFGSGSLQGIPTYWSSFCTFSPTSFLVEWELLNNPEIYVHPLCPVTTPFDMDYNRLMDKQTKHGSVGVGFGATLQRNEDYYKLYVQDLYYDNVWLNKIMNMIKHYYKLDPHNDVVQQKLADFTDAVNRVKSKIKIEDYRLLNYMSPIFEGAQGILLDQDFGFFPNVTRSNTTSKNAINIIKNHISLIDNNNYSIYYVTRSYLTKHGNGFLHNERQLSLKNNENETNLNNGHQGRFRTAELDVNLLNYSLECDNHFSHGYEKNLVITCMDQYEINIEHFLNSIKTKFNNVYLSYGDSFDKIVKYK